LIDFISDDGFDCLMALFRECSRTTEEAFQS